MEALKPRERLVRCLLGEPVDRVPFGVGLGWCPWGETVERWRGESGIPSLEPASFFGFDASFALPSIEAGMFPRFERKVLEEAPDYVVERNSQGITLKNLRTGSMPEFLDYPVRTPDDWDRIKAERFGMNLSGRISQDWDVFRARLKETGEAVQVGTFPYGVFGTPRDLMGVEEMLVAFYDYPEMMHDIMNHLTLLWISLWERVAEEVQIDHIHIWEDMSGKQGSLLSPAMTEAFMMPCYERIADFARSAGVRVVSVDTDGDCSELVPVMMRHGVNMFFPFEVQAGNDIREYRKRYSTLGIMGGLDKRALAGTRADVDVEVEKADWMIRNGGRYIPGFDHLIAPDAKWENYQYAVEQIRRVCEAGQEKGIGS